MKKRHKYHRITKHSKHVAMVILTLGFIVAGFFVLWIASFKIPDLSGLEERRVSQSTKIYDRTGEVLLYDVHENVKRTVVPVDQISRNVKNAAIAIEDTEFYQHHGIRPLSIIRAIIANFTGLGYSQGGSTITQQVVKNTILTTEKSITRKLKEWVLAIKLEQAMDKESILGLYLNESPYGGSMYGIQEASRTFFGKDAATTTLAEAAYLAALPNAPTYFSPYGNHRDKLEARKNLVLQKMLENNFITQEEYDSAKKETVVFVPQGETGITAPHFVLFVKEYLESHYGPRAVSDDGLKVITTLDAVLQAKAEEIVKRNALANKKNFNAENASLVAIDPKTGGILVMVGSRDYFDKEIDGNFNVTIAKRQPGSAFKPFVYATALVKGYTPDTVVFDVPIEFSTYCNPDGTPIKPTDTDKCYQPENYDRIYRGPITMRNALAQSINIPAIQFLYLAGIHDSLQVAQDMGITTLTDPNRYWLTLVLGGGEVTLLDMASAYGVFASNGSRNLYQAVLAVYDKNGALLEQFEPSPTQVIDKDIALQISDILSDNKARAPAFGDNSALYFPGKEVAVKTGTTNDYRDAWILGYTPSIVAGAWAGNNNNSPMEKKVAGFIVAPLWHEFMAFALASTSPSEHFERPAQKDLSGLKPVLRGLWQGNDSYFIDRISGKLATPYTPAETRIEKVVTNPHSILYWVDRNNPRGPKPEQPQNDPQFNFWEYAVQKWVAQNGVLLEMNTVAPTGYDDIHVPGTSIRMSINGVDPNNTYSAEDILNVWINAEGSYPLTKVDFFLNDQFIGSSSNFPFSISFTPSTISNISETNTFKVVGYDTVFNKGEAVAGLNLTFGP